MMLLILIIVGYLCGSIPFGKIIGHRYGIDIQKKGSGNIGFANVRRVLGWRAGLLTLSGDILKGFIPSLSICILVDETTGFLVGLSAVVGHIFPVWLRFKGGKGIATGLGVVLALEPIAALSGVVIYLVAAYITRVSSYSSLAGLFTTASIGIWLTPPDWWHYLILITVACWTLRLNIIGRVPSYDI